MTSASPAPPPDDAKLGILYVLAATFLFNILNVTAKWLADDYSIVEIAFFRNAFALLPCLGAVLVGPGLPSLRTGRGGLHLMRGLGGLVSMLLAFTSYSLMPLADAIAISFATPIFLTALSVPLLGEKVGVHRWSAVIVGFVGILVMAKPSSIGQNLGFITALSGTAVGTFILVSVRRLGRTESPLTIVFYQALVGTVGGAFLLPFGWHTPTLPAFAMFVAMGLLGVVGHFCQTQGFRHAAVAVVGPFNYAGLIWATLSGYLVWHQLPGADTVLGGAIVIASGIYIIYRETRRQRPLAGVTPPQPGGD